MWHVSRFDLMGLDLWFTKRFWISTTKEQNKNLKFLIRIFVYPHLFPLCFSTNETPEKLANVFRSDQKHFCWKKHFPFHFFLFHRQVFFCYKKLDSNMWRNKSNLQKQTKICTEFKKICSLKKVIVKTR